MEKSIKFVQQLGPKISPCLPQAGISLRHYRDEHSIGVCQWWPMEEQLKYLAKRRNGLPEKFFSTLKK